MNERRLSRDYSDLKEKYYRLALRFNAVVKQNDKLKADARQDERVSYLKDCIASLRQENKILTDRLRELIQEPFV